MPANSTNTNSTLRVVSALTVPLPYWSHIELGGANYGKNPNADRTYIRGNGTLNKNQHKLLFKTIDQLLI